MVDMELTSHGHRLNTAPGTFGKLRESNDIIKNNEALHQRIDDDGYLFFRNYLDKNVVLAARQELLQELMSVDELDPKHPMMDAVYSGESNRPPGFGERLRTNIAVKELCHQGKIITFFERFLGGTIRPFDYLWIRTVHPGGSTGCHYDVVYMGRGTHNLFTAWIPVGDVPLHHGALLVLENSHTLNDVKESYGTLDVDRDQENSPYKGGWFSTNPVEVQQKAGGRWLTTDFQIGDILIMTMFTMHCSLDNSSDHIRLSTDSRYQLATDPVDERWIGNDPIGHKERRSG